MEGRKIFHQLKSSGARADTAFTGVRLHFLKYLGTAVVIISILPFTSNYLAFLFTFTTHLPLITFQLLTYPTIPQITNHCTGFNIEEHLVRAFIQHHQPYITLTELISWVPLASLILREGFHYDLFGPG